MTYLSVKNERDGVLSILLFVNEGQEFLGPAAEHVLAARNWTDSSRRLIMRMSRGTLERQITLDQLIGACSSRPVEQIQPVAREILRMSAYCLYHMDSMPEHAVVNEAVELTKKRGLAKLSGFVNGVLRSVLRRKESGEDAETLTSPEAIYSAPSWIIRQWNDDYGKDKALTMLESLYEERPLTARVNETRISREELIGLWRAQGIDCDIIKELKTGISFFSAGLIGEMPGFKEGLFYVQDYGSILAGEIVPLTGGENVLDLCAAPGGKATALAERLLAMNSEAGQTGTVLACDKTEGKTVLIRENASRLGITNLTTLMNDALNRRSDWAESFDVVIADVPCSGLGVIGRKPDIKLRMTPEDITSLIPLQREILDHAAGYVRPGGYLLYSTCTVSRRENEEQVKDLLNKHPEYSKVPFEFDGQMTDGSLQLLPGVHKSDGFYMSLLRKEEKHE